MKPRAKVFAYVGAAGAVASILALWPAFAPKEKPPVLINGNDNSYSQTNISHSGEGSINVHNVYADDRRDVRAARRFVPETYLDNLPRVKANAYRDAHKWWDTGSTDQMIRGNRVLATRLKKVLVDLGKTAYTAEYFEGKDPSVYFDEVLDRLVNASFEAIPENGGAVDVLAADFDLAMIIDDYIERIVQDVTEPGYYSGWKAEWDEAQKAGS